LIVTDASPPDANPPDDSSSGGATEKSHGIAPAVSGPLLVSPTSAADHPGNGLPYVVSACPDVAKKAAGDLGLAFIERNIPGAPLPPLGCLVRLRASDECTDGEIRCDQTVRVALGLPSRMKAGAPPFPCDELRIYPVSMSKRQRASNLASGILGRRYLLLRAGPPFPADIEKGICRIQKDDLAAMGTEEGGRVLLFGVSREKGKFELKSISIQSLELDKQSLGKRATDSEATKNDGWDARYRSATHLLGVDGEDLSPLWIDFDVRKQLGGDSAWPVLVRRDSRSAFSRETQEFGISLLASILALQVIVNPLLDEVGIAPIWRGVVILVAALTAAIGLLVWRLRGDLR
jgi:hypothetical protein